MSGLDLGTASSQGKSGTRIDANNQRGDTSRALTMEKHGYLAVVAGWEL